MVMLPKFLSTFPPIKLNFLVFLKMTAKFYLKSKDLTLKAILKYRCDPSILVIRERCLTNKYFTFSQESYKEVLDASYAN